MSCGFCRTTPINPCPVCSPQTVTPKAIRKPKAKAPRVPAGFQNFNPPKAKPAPAPYVPVPQSTVDAWAKQAMPVIRAAVASWDAAKTAKVQTTPPPPIVAPSPVSARSVTVAGVCCNDCGDVYPAARAIPSGMVRLASGHLVCESCAAKRAAIVRPTPQGAVIDWNAAAQFTLSILNRRKLPEVAGVRVDSTLPPVARGDWAGLGRAVDAGYLTEKQAIDLAASWRAGVASNG